MRLLCMVLLFALLALLCPLGCVASPSTDTSGSVVDRVANTEADPGLPWQEHYGQSAVLSYQLEIEPGLLQAMFDDPLCQGPAPCGDDYVEATLIYGERRFERVGVRFKGNSSRWMVADLEAGDQGYQRYSFKIKLDAFVDQSLDGITKINLNNSFGDPSYMREVISYQLFAAAGVPSSRAGYANLSVNGELYGLYVSVQQVDKSFLEHWYNDDAGNLYKPEGGDLLYKGATIDAYGNGHRSGEDCYELKTNESESDYSGLVHFLDVLNNTPDAQFAGAIAQVFEVEDFLGWLAGNSLLVALDSYAGTIPHNFYLYHNTSTGRFHYIPWDLNGSFGNFTCGLSPVQRMQMDIDVPYCGAGGTGPQGLNAGQRPLIARILAVPEFRERYHQKLEQLLLDFFNDSAMQQRVAALDALISQHVAADPNPFYSHADYQRNQSTPVRGQMGLLDFTQTRSTYVNALLQGQITLECGDGECHPGESCPEDCGEAQCDTCQVFLEGPNRCVPSCESGCTCPTDAPVSLVCNTEMQVCQPEPSCDCNENQVCHPLGGCVPRCLGDRDCPPQVPSCQVETGLCF